MAVTPSGTAGAPTDFQGENARVEASEEVDKHPWQRRSSPDHDWWGLSGLTLEHQQPLHGRYAANGGCDADGVST